MISAVSAITVTILLVLINLPSGFVFVRFLLGRVPTRSNVLSYVVLMICAGIPVNLMCWWCIAQIWFSVWTFWLVPLSATTISVLATKYLQSAARGPETNSGLFFTKANVFFSAIALFAFTFYTVVALYLGWPPPGDPWYHGRMVETIVVQQRYPVDYMPYSSHLILYPLGFHLLVAGLRMTTGFYVGEVMLIAACFVMATISIGIAWVTYARTESLWLTLLAFVLAFYIHPVSRAHFSAVQYFLNGTYPVLLGTEICLVSFLLLSRQGLDNSLAANLKTMSGFAMFALVLLFTYPPFAVVQGFCFLVVVLKMPRKQGSRVLRRGKKLLSAIVSLLLVAIGACLTGQFPYLQYWISSRHVFYTYALSPLYLFNGIVLPILIIGAFGSALCYYSNRRDRFALVSIALTVSLLLSTVPPLFESFLSYLLPNRLSLVVSFASYVFVMEFFNLACERITTLVSQRGVSACPIHWLESPGRFQLLTFLIIGILIFPSVSRVLFFDAQFRANWLNRDPNAQNDFRCMEFLGQVHDDTHLVLNYMSYTDYFLPSFGILNTTYGLAMDRYRAEVLRAIWDHPENETAMRELLATYGVRYILVTSFWAILDFLGNGTVRSRAIDAVTYQQYWDNYSFLHKVFAAGNSCVYEVKASQLPS